MYRIVILLVVLCTGVVHAQKNAAPEFPDLRFNTITEKDGLPSPDGILQLVKDKRGFVWTCGLAGLYRYDGFRFKKMTIAGPAAKQQDFDKYCCWAVAVGDSTFWTSSLEGFMRVNYYTGEYEQYPAKKWFNNPLSFESIVKLNDKQALLAVTGILLLLGTKGIEKKIPLPANKQFSIVWHMFKDEENRVWIDAFRNEYLGRLSTNLDRIDTVVKAIDGRSLLFTGNNRYAWIPTWGAGMQVFDMVTQQLETIPGYATKIFKDISIFKTGSGKNFIAAGIDQGLLLIDPDTKQSKLYPAKTRTGVEQYRIMLGDNGDLWVLNKDGLVYLSSGKETVRNYYFKDLFKTTLNDNQEELFTGYYFSEAGNKKFISIYNEGGLLQLDKNEKTEKYFPFLGNKAIREAKMINALLADRKGRYWVATERAIALCDSNLKVKEWFYIPASDGSHQTLALRQPYLLNDSLLLLRGSYSFHLFDINRKKFLLHRTQPVQPPAGYKGLTGPTRSAWAQDNSPATIWYASDEGVFRYNMYTNQVEKKIDSIGFCGRLTNDRYGNIWIATLQGMLMVDRKNLQVHHFNDLPGAVILPVIGICIDSSGRIWVSGQQGVTGFDPVTKQFAYLSIANGALTNNPMDIITCGKDGRLYVGYYGGFFTFDPGNYFNRSQKAVITEVSVNDVPFLWKPDEQQHKSITLDHNSGLLKIAFASADYYPDNITRYYYRIVKNDTLWHLLDKGELSLVNLAAGRYEVELAHSPYPKDGETDRIFIRIKPPFYLTGWFIAAVIALLVCIVFGIIRNRLQQIKLRNDFEKEKLEKERVTATFKQKLADTELALLHSQMNPHFIFNCLNSIKLYIEQNDIEAASEYLGKFSKLIRTVLDNSSTEKISLQDELESLELYLQMESMRFKEKLRYNISVDKNVDTEFVELPPLLIQPYVENAIWHGLMHKEEGGVVAIHISQLPETLQITIRDNGIGREAAAGIKSKSAVRQKSYGTRLTGDRISLMNERFKTRASVAVTDLVDEKGAAGTLVTIKLSL